MIKEWEKRVQKAIKVIDDAAKKQLYDCFHTADGKDLKEGLIVYLLNEPFDKWQIIEVENKITLKKGIVTLKCNEKDPIKVHPTKIFVNQAKALEARIKDIKRHKAFLIREMNEELVRLDADSQIKKIKTKLKKLRKRVSK